MPEGLFLTLFGGAGKNTFDERNRFSRSGGMEQVGAQDRLVLHARQPISVDLTEKKSRVMGEHCFLFFFLLLRID